MPVKLSTKEVAKELTKELGEEKEELPKKKVLCYKSLVELHVGHKVTIPLNFTKVTGKRSPLHLPKLLKADDTSVCTVTMNDSHSALIVAAIAPGSTLVKYHYA